MIQRKKLFTKPSDLPESMPRHPTNTINPLWRLHTADFRLQPIGNQIGRRRLLAQRIPNRRISCGTVIAGENLLQRQTTAQHLLRQAHPLSHKRSAFLPDLPSVLQFNQPFDFFIVFAGYPFHFKLHPFAKQARVSKTRACNTSIKEPLSLFPPRR